MGYWMMKNLFSFMISIAPEISIFHTGSIEILIWAICKMMNAYQILEEWYIPSFWCSRNTQLLQWVKTLWRYCALCSAQTIFLPLSLYGYGSSLWYGCSPTEHGMEQCDEFNKWLVVWFFAKFSISTVITLKFDNIL